jgi:hypothetical protein
VGEDAIAAALDSKKAQSQWAVRNGDSPKGCGAAFSVAGHVGDVKILYDDSDRKAPSQGRRPECVVVARDKEGKSLGEKLHYVLIVIDTGSVTARDEKLYTRLGVGYMPGKYISLDGLGIAGKVC